MTKFQLNITNHYETLNVKHIHLYNLKKKKSQTILLIFPTNFSQQHIHMFAEHYEKSDLRKKCLF